MSPYKRIGLFLSLTFVLSSLSYVPIIRAGTGSVRDGLFVLTLMWSPGLAAILTQLLTTRSLRGLGWRLGAARWLGAAYFLPAVYALPVYAVAWLTGLGGFRNPYLFSRLTRQYASPDLASAVTVFVLINATQGMLMPLVTALGEEIGWRGLFVPELAKVTSFTRTALISGITWAAWHMPGIFLADYNSGGTPALYSALAFAVMIVGLSFPFAWLRLKSGSLWPAAVLHASHNLFIQGVFDRLTSQNGLTPYLTGEFGLGLALTGLVLAYVFWRLRPDTARRTQIAPAQAFVQPG